METLEKLEKELKENHLRACKISDEIHKIKNSVSVSDIIDKYEGKYWRYRNSNIVGDWGMYLYCVKVLNKSIARFNTFETYQGKYNYSTEYFGFHLCKVEINKDEYIEALNRFKLAISKLS